ncbi:MAG TPA: hypothetical protein VFV50_18120, partial [Bdellovibrionales bacterium]|nr:hypothetical protein [Bdellovibrionales bacterium]
MNMASGAMSHSGALTAREDPADSFLSRRLGAPPAFSVDDSFEWKGARVSRLENALVRAVLTASLIAGTAACGPGMSPAGDAGQSAGSWFPDTFAPATPYPAYTNYNPNTTLASDVGLDECRVPVSTLANNVHPSKVAVAANGDVWAVTGCGLFRSRDEGRTYQTIETPDAIFSQALTVDGDSIYIGTLSGLYISRDGGATFTHSLSIAKA